MSDVVWTGDLNAFEVATLARFAASPDFAPPRHVQRSLHHRGWLYSESGRMVLSPHARSVIGRLVATGSSLSLDATG